MKTKTKTQNLLLFVIASLISLLAFANHANAQWSTSGNTTCTSSKLGSTDTSRVCLYSNNICRIFIKGDGNIGIGTQKTSGFKLSIEGKARAREIVVNSDTWSDFVFDYNYKLMNLKTLEAYVAMEHHLPGVPTAAEVKENGVAVGEMNKILLQKIEELTLYVIQQQKEIDELKSKK